MHATCGEMLLNVETERRGGLMGRVVDEEGKMDFSHMRGRE
jgi:hypothetical protein